MSVHDDALDALLHKALHKAADVALLAVVAEVDRRMSALGGFSIGREELLELRAWVVLQVKTEAP